MSNLPRFYANSRTPAIIGYIMEGWSHKDIAAKLGCSVAHVGNVSSRHVRGRQTFTVAGLSHEHYLALNTIAQEIECSTAELARSYIIDGLAEELERRKAVK